MQFAGASVPTQCYLKNIPAGTPAGNICAGFPLKDGFPN